jgi:hypothetical protein
MAGPTVSLHTMLKKIYFYYVYIYGHFQDFIKQQLQKDKVVTCHHDLDIKMCECVNVRMYTSRTQNVVYRFFSWFSKILRWRPSHEDEVGRPERLELSLFS